MKKISLNDLRCLEYLLFNMLNDKNLSRSDYRELSNSITTIVAHIHKNFYIYWWRIYAR